MQKKTSIFFIVLGVPTFGEGGVELVGTKSQVFPKSSFEGSPKDKDKDENFEDVPLCSGKHLVFPSRGLSVIKILEEEARYFQHSDAEFVTTLLAAPK